jgi:CheY-like chemotaxis protein
MKKAIADKELANQALNDFLRNVSHEIRTPLSGILGFSEAIEQSSVKKDMIKYAGIISDEGEKLLSLINRLLDISKIEAGKLEIANQVFNIRASLRKFCRAYGERAKLKGLQFSEIIDERLPEYLSGDEDRLIQILTNLVGNAIKFTKQGMIVFKVSVGDPGPECADQDSFIAVGFEISDTGIGIEKHKQAAILQPFEQEDASISREFGGTGLGTSISGKLVALMDGKLDFESKKGIGSRFWFTLEFKVPDQSQLIPEPRQRTAEHRFSGKKILVAEDYKINQQILRLYLEKLGCMLTIVEDGRECIEYLKKEKFDLVLLDVQMPVMDGIEAISIIRKTPKLKNIAVIGITVNAFESDLKKYLKAGMNDIILKPFRKDEIIRKLDIVFSDSSE